MAQLAKIYRNNLFRSRFLAIVKMLSDAFAGISLMMPHAVNRFVASEGVDISTSCSNMCWIRATRHSSQHQHPNILVSGMFVWLCLWRISAQAHISLIYNFRKCFIYNVYIVVHACTIVHAT